MPVHAPVCLYACTCMRLCPPFPFCMYVCVCVCLRAFMRFLFAVVFAFNTDGFPKLVKQTAAPLHRIVCTTSVKLSPRLLAVIRKEAHFTHLERYLLGKAYLVSSPHSLFDIPYFTYLFFSFLVYDQLI